MKHVAVACTALLLAGCGGGGGSGSAQDVLSETAANLGKIRAGTLHLELVVTPRGKGLGGATGFRINGPFGLSSGKRYPTANIAYTQLASGKSATVRVVSNGRTGYVQSNGARHALTAVQLELLRRAAATSGDPSGGLADVVIDRWIVDPKLSDGGDVGGTATDHVHARLDVVQTVNGLLPLAPGTHVMRITGQNAKRLAHAVRSSSFDVYTGKDDHLLRRATVDVDFALDVPKQLRQALGDLVGAKVHFLVGVDDPRKR